MKIPDRIKVMPDFSSSGIWRLNGGVMLDYDELHLSPELIKDFEEWIEFYDRKCHTRNYAFTSSAVKAKKMNDWGKRFARKLKKLWPDVYIEYWGENLRGLTKVVIK